MRNIRKIWLIGQKYTKIYLSMSPGATHANFNLADSHFDISKIDFSKDRFGPMSMPANTCHPRSRKVSRRQYRFVKDFYVDCGCSLKSSFKK